MNIQYLTYREIDKQKWDDCIRHSQNSLIYGYSFYLNAMAAHWDGLVLDDYEAVMPLPWKRKWGIKYLYQPPFIQQVGVFFKNELTNDQLKSFVDKAFEKFNFAEITLNYANNAIKENESSPIASRNNFILDLNRPYETLYDNYDPAFTKSLRRIRKFELLYASSVNYHKIIELYKHLYGKRLPFFPGRSYKNLEKVCKKLFKEDRIIIRHARSVDNEQLASVMLLRDENRLYNIISCITSKGKRLEANYFLYDSIIEEFSNTAMLLDFEGSDVEGIANFYKKFNPENQPYPFIKHNNLPAFIKMFKS